MRAPTSGQSSQRPGDARILAPRHWRGVPAQVVWEFAVDLCTHRHTLREVAAMVDLAPETVRKFILRKGKPTLKTRRRFAELYLEMHAEGVVMEPNEAKPWKARPRLIELLSRGEGPARAELAKLFELAQRFPDEVPLSIERVQEWMDLQIRGEYWAEDYYGAIGRGEREHDEQSFLGSTPKRKRGKKKADEDDGESR